MTGIDLDELDTYGFCLVQKFSGPGELSDLMDLFERKSKRLFGPMPSVLAQRLSRLNIGALVQNILGAPPSLARVLLFNKNEQNNWFVPWHQDRTIVVHDRAEVDGYTHWTRKGGQWHVEPPADILRKMITLRLHLDATDSANGALRVVPKSHVHGKLTQQQIATICENTDHVQCISQPGDLLVMKPLLVHSSLKSKMNRPRRILHLEYACEALPDPLAWCSDVCTGR